jgi:putative cardiolipin synthase
MSIRRAGLALMFLIALLGSGCASLPPGADFPKAASKALMSPEQTQLGRQLAASASKHPGLSGFRLLAVGLDSFQLRMDLVRAAERTLDLQYFLIECDDNTGQLLLEATLQAADRGVRTRILLDDSGSFGRDAQINMLAGHPNIELRLFNPFAYRGQLPLFHTVDLVLNAYRLNYRMHNKLFVVDNAIGIVGGRNIGDEYFQAAAKFEFGDYDVIAAGPVVRNLSDSFDAYWNSPMAIPIDALTDGKPSEEAMKSYRDSLAAHRLQLEGAPYVQPLPAGQSLAAMLSGKLPLIWAKAEVIYDSPEKLKVESGEQPGYLLRYRLREVTAETRSELIIVSPYLVPGPGGMRFFEKLHERNIRVRVLTNSLASTDMPIVHSRYQTFRVPMLEKGVELYEVRPVLGEPVVGGHELKSPSSGQYALHAKVFVFDRQRIFIGSMNLDPRSLRVNTEVGLIIESPELAHQVADRFAEIAQPANSYVIALDEPDNIGRRALVWHTMENGKPTEYHQDPAAAFVRRLQVDALSLLPLDELL